MKVNREENIYENNAGLRRKHSKQKKKNRKNRAKKQCTEEEDLREKSKKII